MNDLSCTIKTLADHLVISAAKVAVRNNPTNAPRVPPNTEFEPQHLALVTSRYWGVKGVHLTVAFLDGAPADLQARILAHMNAWGAFCNVKFVPTNTDPQVRIVRGQGGYWSYLVTDILSVPANQQTMNLEGFTMNTPESEFHRVVRHETGHTLGFPHEHMRQQLIERLDPNKTIAWGQQQLGWSRNMVISQILTPLSEASIRGTPNADQDSIMCYQLPGSITIDGQPIRGGVDIDPLDQTFAASQYPLEVAPPPPPKPPPNPTGGTDVFAKILALLAAFKAKDYLGAFKILVDILSGLQSGAIPASEVDEVHAQLQALPAAAPKKP